MSRFRKDRTATGGLGRLQDSLDAGLRRETKDIRGIDILNGELLTEVSIGASDTKVRHTLGRPWKGAFVVREKDGLLAEYVFSDADDNSRFLTARASAARTADIWVF